MASECIPRSSRWFSNVGLRISLHKKKSKGSTSASSSSSSGSPRSPLPPPSIPFGPTGRSREEELREVFRHFDMDNDGMITALELRRYFNSIGEIITEEEAQEVIDELDSDNDGMLEFKDFVKLMDSKEGADEDMKKVFEMFEHEKGSGRITPRGLQRALNRLGDSKSFKECASMIRVYDTDGDGELDFNDFHQMMAV
ncbi:probable calcium-binding protein CML41 [Chenopodium quinoa]|uniref:probable calcium-binding protein CML41 n=1 Tax=Chenopodium quinoa TaxID=63459 RepID=UPI000B781073|nr:probable calcium-binding protein CML41 [Chenopodium quinoa]